MFELSPSFAVYCCCSSMTYHCQWQMTPTMTPATMTTVVMSLLMAYIMMLSFHNGYAFASDTNDGIDHYLISLDGIGSVPCGRLPLSISGDQACSQLGLAIMQIESSMSSSISNISYISVTAELYHVTMSAHISRSHPYPYTIIILGLLDPITGHRPVLNSLSLGGAPQLTFNGAFNVTVQNLILTGGHYFNAALFMAPSTDVQPVALTLISCDFTNNRGISKYKTGHAVVVYAVGLSQLNIRGCLFEGNQMTIINFDDYSRSIVHVNMRNGGIVHIVDSIYQYNWIHQGAGSSAMSITNASHIVACNLTIAHNEIILDAQNWKMTHGMVYGAWLMSSPSFDEFGGNSVVITNSIILNNTVALVGPKPSDETAIRLMTGAGITIASDGSMTLISVRGSIFESNSITSASNTWNSTGAGLSILIPSLFGDEASPQRAKVIINGSAHDILISDCSFVNNKIISGHHIHGAGWFWLNMDRYALCSLILLVCVSFRSLYYVWSPHIRCENILHW
jgi:hypothetical protein